MSLINNVRIKGREGERDGDRETERDRERQRDREREREREGGKQKEHTDKGLQHKVFSSSHTIPLAHQTPPVPLDPPSTL